MKHLFRFFVIAGVSAFVAVAQPGIWTGQYNQQRTSANLEETILNPSNVNANQFGMLFTRAVDDYIYAQPLYLPHLTIAGAAHNVVYVATINNSVYAYDADNPSLATALWQVNLGPPDTLTQANALPRCGILSTPVIDTSTGTMYVVSLTEQNNQDAFNLHALSVTTGAEKFGGPVLIKATASGTGVGSSNGKIAFNAADELQRPALLLLNETVYMGFARQKEEGVLPYHGWVLGYNAKTLKQTFAMNTTPNGSEGGVWMSGRGPAADSAGFTFITGNGDVGNGDVGQSFVRYSLANQPAGLFTSPNYIQWNTNDFDLGSSGPLIVPGTNRMLGGGKSGLVYLLNINGTTLQPVQNVQATPGCATNSDASCAQIHSPAFWDLLTTTQPSLLYIWASGDVLKAFSFAGGLLSTTPVYQNTQIAAFPGGGALALSASGTNLSSGILWATMSTQNASNAAVPGVLHAFNAANIGTELWNSSMNASDQYGNLAKFAAPVVVNGKVYVATFSNQLAVYGLKPTN